MFSFVEEQRLFQAEVAFYQLITAAELRVKTPLYLFHTDSPRRLALEDKSHGTRCFGLQPGMSLRQCVAAVREVAKIHALTYGAAVERWPHMAQLLAEQAGLHAELLGACFIDGLRELRRRAPGLCEGEEAWRVLEGLGRRSAVLTQELAKGREQRLAHGDYWCGNVLFEDGRDVVAALLDFQFAAFKQLEWLDVIMMVRATRCVCCRRGERLYAHFRMLVSGTDRWHRHSRRTSGGRARRRCSVPTWRPEGT